jgi:hypothetical protein
MAKKTKTRSPTDTPDGSEIKHGMVCAMQMYSSGSLVGGSPLQVEDLDVIMNVVTYQIPHDITEAKWMRLFKHLMQRGINFQWLHVIRPYFFHRQTHQWCLRLDSGRETLFMEVI